MNDDEKRIAIAEACGAKWQDVPSRPDALYHPKRLLSFHTWDFHHPRCAPLPFPDPDTCDAVDIPDYLNDLNAMHEAEKTLTEEEQTLYAGLFDDQKLNDGYHGYIECPPGLIFSHFMHASARERAEAFIAVKQYTASKPAPKL